MITCDHALELLSAQLDGALTAEEQAALQAHLQSCPECRAAQRELSQLNAALPALEQEPPRLLRDGVMQEIRRESRAKKERKPLLRFVAALAAAAAVLAVLAGFRLVSLPGFDHGESAVSMADSLFPKSSARDYAEALCEQTGCRVLLIEHCGVSALSGSFETLEGGIYRQKTTEAALDEAERALSGSFSMTICGARSGPDAEAFLLCTD